jgi:hypothetical protein
MPGLEVGSLLQTVTRSVQYGELESRENSWYMVNNDIQYFLRNLIQHVCKNFDIKSNKRSKIMVTSNFFLDASQRPLFEQILRHPPEPIGYFNITT